MKIEPLKPLATGLLAPKEPLVEAKGLFVAGALKEKDSDGTEKLKDWPPPKRDAALDPPPDGGGGGCCCCCADADAEKRGVLR